MRSKIGKKSLIAIGLLMLAVGIYFIQNMQVGEAAPSTTAVIIANDYIPENTVITSDMIQEDQRATEDLLKQKGDITSKSEKIVDKRTISPIFSQEPVNMNRLVDNEAFMDEKDDIEKTLWTIAIDSNDKALNINKGSYIDIWLKPTENGRLEGIKVSQPFVKYKVYDTKSEAYNETGKASKDEKQSVTTYLTLYLTDAEIEKFLDVNEALVQRRISLHGKNMDYEIVKEQIYKKAEKEIKEQEIDLSVVPTNQEQQPEQVQQNEETQETIQEENSQN